ncbi:type IV pilin N-terminal domain-containing protein [Methanogenium sp. MK-MG]|uniref:type IV pilin N-terminal domain-containing protein n=1 Tax=Methanogenium sp. MK-MG TaxID=2599926 RepID=UPI0013EB0E7C|nr:type IV pilin N-terminal domain-containing protein [Methanogenium sp. MK-MG]KAF1076440.1 hypothetical protein MKMG_01486 [Methanogenium sp. MK-MG]
MNNTKEDAVSPVIGVMLMLAVTIIIAACVSAFAGGASTQFEETPQTSLLVYCDGSGDAFSIIFEHHSGASIQSEKLKIITWIKAEDNTIIKHEQSGISPRSSSVTPALRIPYVYDAQKGILPELEFGEAMWKPGFIAGTGNKAATAEFLGVSEEDLDELIASDTPVEVTIVYLPNGNTLLKKEFILG